MQKNPLELIKEYKEFVKKISPEEAEKQVRELVNSGRIDKRMFNEIKEQADVFRGLLGGKYGR